MSQQENEKKAQVFSNRMIGARKLKALSQQELADKLGVHLRSVQNWESGSEEMPMPQGKNLRNICETLDVSPSYLFGEEMRYPAGELGPHIVTETREGTEAACREHLDRFLETCRGEDRRLGWTYIELHQHFPLDKWAQPEVVMHQKGKPKPASLPLSDQEESSLGSSLSEVEPGDSGESEQSSEAGARHLRTKSQPDPSSPGTKPRRSGGATKG